LTHNFFYDMFIWILYMFRTTLCSSSGGQLYEYNIWYSHSVLVVFRYTRRPLTQSDYTRCCIHTIGFLRMSTELLETCRRFKLTYRRRNCTSSWLPTRSV